MSYEVFLYGADIPLPAREKAMLDFRQALDEYLGDVSAAHDLWFAAHVRWGDTPPLQIEAPARAVMERWESGLRHATREAFDPWGGSLGEAYFEVIEKGI